MTRMNKTARPPQNVDFIWIDSKPELVKFCRQLALAGAFGFDTEFIGERTYLPELCLIQLCGAEQVALVDPMAINDLTPLGELMIDANMIKYCHAGEQDIAIMHQCGFTPVSVFDTQLMAGLLGLVYPISYAKLVEHICGVQLDKAHTYSAWDRRPLANAQLMYAADDVRYLPAVYGRLREQIESHGRLEWMNELCAEELKQAVEPPDPRSLWLKIKVPRSMSREQLGVLRELTAWRHQLAYEHDTPVRAFMTDAAIRDVAKMMPRSMAQLSWIEGISEQELHSYGPFMLDLIQKVRESPRDQLPESLQEPRDSLECSRYIERVWAAAQVICLGQSVTTGLVTSQTAIADWAARKMAGENLDTHELMRGWRRECLGKPLEEMVEGRSQLTISMNGNEFKSSIQTGN
ncbi:MAG: ribonuclease D [Phycisphaerae bacterium]